MSKKQLLIRTFIALTAFLLIAKAIVAFYKYGDIRKEYDSFLLTENYHEEIISNTDTKATIPFVNEIITGILGLVGEYDNDEEIRTQYMKSNTFFRSTKINVDVPYILEEKVNFDQINYNEQTYVKLNEVIEKYNYLKNRWIKFEKENDNTLLDANIKSRINMYPSAYELLSEKYIKKEVEEGQKGNMLGEFKYDLTPYGDDLVKKFDLDALLADYEALDASMVLKKSKNQLSKVIIEIKLKEYRNDSYLNTSEQTVIHKIEYKIEGLGKQDISNKIEEIKDAKSIAEIRQSNRLSEDEIKEKLFLGSKDAPKQLTLFIQPLCSVQGCNFMNEGFKLLVLEAEKNKIGLQIIPSNTFPPESRIIQNIIFCAASEGKVISTIQTIIAESESYKKNNSSSHYYAYIVKYIDTLRNTKYKSLSDSDLGVGLENIQVCMEFEYYDDYSRFATELGVDYLSSDILIRDQNGNEIENPDLETLQKFIQQ